jgi:hypothetical protein
MSTTLCDRDTAETAAYVIMTPAGPLAFCGHHYHVNEPAITDAGYPVELLTGPGITGNPAFRMFPRTASQPSWRNDPRNSPCPSCQNREWIWAGPGQALCNCGHAWYVPEAERAA